MGPTELALEAVAMITSSGSGTTGTLANLTPSQNRRIASDITATMQTIYTIAPAIYKRSMSADMAAPVTDSLTATDGSDVVTTSYAFGEGCSVFVGGIMNEIRTEGGVKRLRFPFAGTSGAQAAVFYDDCVVLDPTVARVIGPVYSSAHPTYPIKKLDNRADLEHWRCRSGLSQHYWVEPFLLQSAGASPGVTVSGTLDPDATGDYIFAGLDEGGHPFHALNGYVIVYTTNNGPRWKLGTPVGIGDGEDWYLTATDTASPVGTYTAEGDNTGSPVVTNTAALGSGQQSTLRLRIVPVPSAREEIGYDVTVRAPKITVDDLGTDMVPSTVSLVVAEDYHELLVRPIFLQLFAGSPWFRGDPSLRKRLDEDDKAARVFLKEYRPQQECNRTIRPMGEWNRPHNGRYYAR